MSREIRCLLATVGIATALAACSSSAAKTTPTTVSPTTTTPSSSSTTSGSTSAKGLQGNASGGALEQAAATSALQGPVGSGLTRGVTATSVTVGCIQQSADFPGFQQGVQARIARANKTGVAGRKITLLPCADDTSTQGDVLTVQRLVNQDNAFAVIGTSLDLTPASTGFLNSNQVPFIGWGFTPGFCGTRWGFGWNGCVLGASLPPGQIPHGSVQGNLAAAIIKASGLPDSQVRLAIQQENSPQGTAGAASYAVAFGAVGAKIVYSKSNFPVSAAGADVTPYVQAVLATNPNIIELGVEFTSVGPLASALRAAGYKGLIYDFVTYVPGLLGSSAQLAAALNGEYINTQIIPQEANTPYVQQELQDMQAIGQPPFLSEGASLGYASAEALVEMLQAVGSNLNTQTFDQTINGGSFTSYTGITGGPGQLKWPASHTLAADCAAIMKVSGKSYQVAVPFACYQSVGLF